MIEVSLFGFQGVGKRFTQIKAQRSGFDLKRRCNEMSEFSPKGGNERYGVCIDDAPLAQLVEQLTLNQWVPGSNP